MCCPNCREIEYGNWHFPEGEGAHEEYDEEVSDDEEEEPELLPGEQAVELRFCPPVEVETQVARDISENRATITSFPPRVFVLMGCAEHCPSSSQGCTRTCSSTPLTPIHL
uniref:Uncharacterized protein n=1 Tax=Nicotiana tabacum TaxID=4097 RepID=A0A1S3XM33_TOBAC|nr:PREDICTED: uncharacterized protein LOC107766599 [Nicotiana tabacum]